MKKHILFMVLFFLTCSDSAWNYDLGGGYSYLKSGGAMDVSIYKGDGLMYKSLFDDPIVFPEIEVYKFDKKFIVCKQNYNEGLTNELLQSAFEFRYHEIYDNKNEKKYIAITNYVKEFEDEDLFYKMCLKIEKRNKIGFTKIISDSILANNKLFLKMKKQKNNYYIIDKNENNIFLVLNKLEFNKLFKKLKISDSLKID